MGERAFDPGKYLTHLNGRDYLEVRWRLLWLRTEHPEAVVQTEMAHHETGMAIFKARVVIPGDGEATGWGMETAEDFGDYVEKAETKALGRALAALGYGTQFCEEFEGGPGEAPGQARGAPVIVDAPGQRPAGKPSRESKETPATAAQVKAIYAIARTTLDMDEERTRERSTGLFGTAPERLTKAQASRFIDLLRREAPARRSQGDSSGVGG